MEAALPARRAKSCWKCGACASKAWPTTYGTRSCTASTCHLRRGEVLGLIGESGAGKSTIGIASMGYAKPGCRISAGTIMFDGMDLRKASEASAAQAARRRASPMSRSPPAASFNPAHKLIEQYCEMPVQHGVKPRAEAEQDAKDIYRRLRLPDPGQHRLPLSAPGLRRPAAARHDRHGHVVPAGPHHFRRAHDGPGRDHPDRGSGRHQGHRRAVQHGGHLHHPRPGGGGADGRQDHGAAATATWSRRFRPPDDRGEPQGGIHQGSRGGAHLHARTRIFQRQETPLLQGQERDRQPTAAPSWC